MGDCTAVPALLPGIRQWNTEGVGDCSGSTVEGGKEGPEQPLGPQRRGAAFSTQPLGSVASPVARQGSPMLGVRYRSVNPRWILWHTRFDAPLPHRLDHGSKVVTDQLANTSRPSDTVRTGRSSSVASAT